MIVASGRGVVQGARPHRREGTKFYYRGGKRTRATATLQLRVAARLPTTSI
jgi:hypothetical protein